MKKFVAIIVCGFLFTQSIYVSGQQATFSKVFYDSLQNGIQTYSVIPAIDSGYMLAGQSTYGGGLIFKIDTGGNLLWNKKIGVSGYDAFNSIIQTSDSNYILTGYTYNISNGNLNALCIKLNSLGDTIWSKEISQSAYNIVPLFIQETKDTGFIITGYADSINFGRHGVLVIKLDITGNLQWLKILNGASGSHYGYSVKQTSDTGYIISGHIENNNPNTSNGLLIKLSSTGDVIWANEYNEPANYSTSIFDVLIADSGYVCYFGGGPNAIILKTDSLGNILWSNTNVQIHYYQCYDCPTAKLHKTYDNGYVIVTKDCLGSDLTKVDSAGTFLWVKNIQINANDVLETPDSGLLIAGNGPLCGFFMPVSSLQIGLIKTDSLGNGQACVMTNNPWSVPNTIVASPLTFTVLSGGIDSAIYPAITSEVIVHEVGCVPYIGGIHENNFNNNLSIYPNPSSGNFTLSSTNLIENGVIEIYDILGEKIFNENILNSSKVEIKLNPVCKGMYFIKVRDGESQYSQKLLIE